MKNTCFLFFILLAQSTFTQNEYWDNRHGNTWIFGAGSWGNSIMTFDSPAPQFKVIKPTFIGMGYPSSTMSDKKGNFIFATNGISVVNKQLKIMKNGSRLNPGPYSDIFNWNDDGLPIFEGSMCLSFPHNDSIYYILHEDLWTLTHSGRIWSYAPLYYSKINMNRENGLGEVVELSRSVANDSVFPGIMTACRHANGRDWWVKLKVNFDPIYRTYLIAEDRPRYVFSEPHTPTVNAYDEPWSQSVYTPNGQKFIVLYANLLKEQASFDIYDFDRCSGKLSNFRRVPFLDSLYGVTGCAVSPNSRFLYISQYDYIFQYDLEATDIAATKDTVAKYDGFRSPITGCPTTFFLSRLAEDGKIYVSVGPCGADYLTVIHEPDKKGERCKVEQHAIQLGVNNLFIIPNTPNYRLGRLKGSPCDTIRVATQELDDTAYQLSISPNPATDRLTIEVTLPHYEDKTELVLCDLTGKELIKTRLPDYAYIGYMDVSQLAAGMYILQLRQRGGVLKSEKVVVER